MQELNIGTKVKYHTGDQNWKTGVIHGIRKIDNTNGVARVLAYIVDTGKDFHLDVTNHNLKDLALSREVKKNRDKGLSFLEAAKAAEDATKKMPDEMVEEVTRQPEQLDIRLENIRAR